ncbi:hypothetical protein TNCV_5058241 [Trichonephila clavipes]|nr:hypothetical protein TNCV_5058241 [Trichonephila clavipes]
MFDGLVAFAMDRWPHDCGARRVRIISRPGSPMSEGRFDLSTFRSERTNEASTLTITPKRSSSRDVEAFSARKFSGSYRGILGKRSPFCVTEQDLPYMNISDMSSIANAISYPASFSGVAIADSVHGSGGPSVCRTESGWFSGHVELLVLQNRE